MEELLRTTVAWIQRQDAITAAVLTGSRGGQRQTDQLSDLDVALFGEGLDRYTSDSRWMSEISPVWVYIPEKTSDGFPTRLVIFEGGKKVDFTFGPLTFLEELVEKNELPESWEMGYRVLVDKIGIARRLPAPRRRPHANPRPTEEEYSSLVSEFWFEVWHVGKHLWRDDLWHAKYRDWTTKKLLLAMIEWHGQSRHMWENDTRYLGVEMRQWVEDEAWIELHRSFGRFDADDSWQALTVTARLFGHLAREVGEGLRYPYDQEAETNILSFIDGLRGPDGG